MSRFRALPLILLLHGGGARATDADPWHALPLLTADQIAHQALEACASEGVTVAVAVTDADGLLRVELAADGSAPIDIEAARRKAVTAALLRRPSRGLAGAMTAAPGFVAQLQSLDNRILPMTGGLPIRRGAEIVGAIGVGGSPDGAADERCAAAGIAKVPGLAVGS